MDSAQNDDVRIDTSEQVCTACNGSGEGGVINDGERDVQCLCLQCSGAGTVQNCKY